MEQYSLDEVYFKDTICLEKNSNNVKKEAEMKKKHF